MIQDKTHLSACQAWTFQKSEMVQFLGLLFKSTQVTEVRALGASMQSHGRPATISGYFDDPEKLANAVTGNIRRAKGIYVVPNPVNPALLSRAVNRLRPIYKEPTTSDADILTRRWLMIDIDPVRPCEISSTNAEHEKALAKAQAICDELTRAGWPEPILADSGNGGHLLYRINLPTQDGGIVQKCLEALAFWHDDDELKIDQKVCNPARIWKLYGTMACKGDDTPDRPHRMARLLTVPQELVPVPLELLEQLAASLPATKKNDYADEKRNGKMFDIEAWLAEHELKTFGPSKWKDGRKWVFEQCPWNPDHTNRSAYIVQFSNGAVAAGCHHNSCAGKDWHALRELVEPDWRENHDTAISEKNEKRGNSCADRLCNYVLDNNPLFFLDQFGQPHMLWEGQPLSLTSRCYGVLRRLLWEKEKRAASGDALMQTAGTLAALAQSKNEIYELHVRSAWHNGALYVELAPTRVVCIDAVGWRVDNNPPVYFRRFSNSRELPTPEGGGDIAGLIGKLPLKSERDRRLFLAYLVLGLRSDIPRPILLLTGPQGAAKSTTDRVVKRLLDPAAPESIRLDPRDALQKSFHAAVVFVDNATHFPDWAVDFVCRLVTGEGDSKRRLYTDDDDVIYELRRLVLINGINTPTDRPDFLDRCLCIDVERIEASKRIPEKEFWRGFELECARWLGSIFSLLSAAMRCREHINLPTLPRLADWGEWAAAVYEAKGWGASKFLADWGENVGVQNRAVLDASLLAQTLLGFMSQHAGDWEGSPTELLDKLRAQAQASKLDTEHDKHFPKSVNWLWKRIREIMPILEAQNLKILRVEENSRNIIIRNPCKDS